MFLAGLARDAHRSGPGIARIILYTYSLRILTCSVDVRGAVYFFVEEPAKAVARPSEMKLGMGRKHYGWMVAGGIWLCRNCGEQDRFALGDDDGVLVMGRKAAVGGADGPAVAVERDAAGAGGDDRLDGDDQALGEKMAGCGIGVVWDAGIFVNGAANAVAAEFADDVEAAAADFAFDGAADVFGAIAGAGGGESLVEGAFGAVGESARFFLRGRDLDSDGGIGVVAVFDGG